MGSTASCCTQREGREEEARPRPLDEDKGSAVEKLSQGQRNRIEGGNSKSSMGRIVGHPLFDLLCVLMIITNSVVIGHEVQWLTNDDAEPPNGKILGLFCAGFFIGELLLRVTAHGALYFFVHSVNRSWNWFDFALVVMSFFDIVSIAANSGASTVGMVLKLLRILRLVRLFRFFRELSQLALMLIDPIKSLIWVLVMLGIVIYVFAIFFTSLASDYVKLKSSDGPALVVDVVDEHFGSLWSTMFTLFHSMLNGINWYRIPVALYSIPDGRGPVLAFGFVVYLSFTMLVVLNVITALFVRNHLEMDRTRRELLAQKEVEVKEQWLREMRSIFQEMNTDGSGTASKDKITEFCNDDRVQYYLTALGLDVHDTERLFELLENRDGELEVDEFLAGCLRLKGTARSIDVCSLAHQSRQVCRRLEEIEKVLHSRVPLADATPGVATKR